MAKATTGHLASLAVTPTPIMGGNLNTPGFDDVASPTPSYADRYNTYLSAPDEAAFQDWLRNLSQQKGYDASQDLADYDLRGAWKSGAATASNGHLPDTFKKPNHPTFSQESEYSSPQAAGGAWQDLGNDKWAFQASPFNLQMTGPGQLADYFGRVEPDASLRAGNPIQPTPTNYLSSLSNLPVRR